MRKLALLLLLLFAAWTVAFVRVQPRASASIFRTGERVTVRTRPVYIKPFRFETRCRVATLGELLRYEIDTVGVTASADEFPVRVRFAYKPPSSVPSQWPAGDWCAALDRMVAERIDRWARTETIGTLTDRRGAGERASSHLARTLAIGLSGVSVQISLPPHFERLRVVEEVAARTAKRPPVIFIGLDGADWELLDRYMASGTMPALKAIVATGARGVLETEHPPLSPLLWTTMMTGVGPLDHAILDFTRFNPHNQQREPITSDERRTPAVWNMLTYGGKRVAHFGLWATYAAEEVHGVNVSDRLSNFLYVDTSKPEGIVYPPSRQTWAEKSVEAAEQTVTIERLREYLPGLTEADFDASKKVDNPYGEPVAALRRILVETEIYRRLSSDYLKGNRGLPDLTIVYLQGTDTIGHVFAPYAPPRQPQVSAAEYERFQDVPRRYFREIDAILSEYVTIADRAGAVLMIASDHGFRWHEGRPTAISSTATATAAKWHRTDGIYLLRGPGVAPAPTRVLRGGIRQVCATLLALAGMPAAANIAPPLAPITASSSVVDYRRHFTPAVAPPRAADTTAAQEEIAKLRALGYIGSTESTRSASASADTRTAGAYNNAGLILRQAGRVDEALAAFDRAMKLDPGYASTLWNASETLFGANRDLDRADQLLAGAVRNGLAEGPRHVIERAIVYSRTNRAARSLALLDAAVSGLPRDADLRLFRGRYRMDRNDCRAALEDFSAATQARPNDALAWASAGLAQMCVGDANAARMSFQRSLAIDPNQPQLRQFSR